MVVVDVQEPQATYASLSRRLYHSTTHLTGGASDDHAATSKDVGSTTRCWLTSRRFVRT